MSIVSLYLLLWLLKLSLLLSQRICKTQQAVVIQTRYSYDSPALSWSTSINPSAFHILTPLSFWSYSGFSYTVSFFYPSVQEKLHKPGKERVRWVSQNYRRNCNAIKIHIDPGTKVPFLTVENRLEFLKTLMDLYKPPHINTGEPSTLINQALQHHREIHLSVDKRPGMGDKE